LIVETSKIDVFKPFNSFKRALLK